ncbi:type 1 glutamine amidotransferase [Nocardioides lianchengensis]|uniref:GMP synthase (Glutamine-hydrolysing) n=1 Tax=Nocardioides lianchengensis TaxID=1045774 RepID=A0A1G6W5W6_9ACTN|nr:type 1 glutamine amidotransferase [Nocardioides lianchengensis]NYG09422.1 GMP synthase (glutamine-hydrolyzing) [Nocardioides lianchengensis]SDD61330.1 GMP synthase (glutamine-hydrolysing) [Nocardioides lianchengensis]
MPILVVQHEDDCPPALVGGWLADAGAQLDVRRPYAGDDLPATLADHDALLVLGGSMGADDDAEHAWLAPTKALARAAVADGVPLLGICLGHQLVSSALGGVVRRNPAGQQLGLLEVGWTAEAATDELFGPLAEAPAPARGAHWNNDVVVEPPPGAVLLATAPAGEVQALRFGPRAWGLQLHPEVDHEILGRWAADDAGSHEAAGIDQAELLGAVEAAAAELEATWAPLAHGFARVAARVSPS